MPKICPNCQAEYEDNHSFCSNCGSKLVDKLDMVNPMLNLGDANAISGGVNIDQSKNVTSHDVHYHSTTVQERVKNDSELKLNAANKLRAKAQEMMAERGRIDSVAMNQLRPLSVQLGVDDEIFRTIIKDVRANGNGTSRGLNVANARYLQQAQQAVQTNNLEDLSNLTSRLEAMASISQDDNVQYIHYLSLSILYPLKSIDVYENQTDENYWRTFWAIVSYIRTGNSEQTVKLLTKFDPVRYEMSPDDQNLLEAFSAFMTGDKDGAQEFLDEILGEVSEQVRPFHRAMETMLYEEQPESLEIRFYQDRVLSKSDTVVNIQDKSDTHNNSTTVTSWQQDGPVSSQPAVSNANVEKLYLEACNASGAKKVMLLQQAVNAGSLDAMLDLGDCYDEGDGVPQDLSRSFQLLKKSADLGCTRAQAYMGMAYYVGPKKISSAGDYSGIFEQDYNLSIEYFLSAAESGSTEAIGWLCRIYYELKDYEQALLWARKGAIMYNADAMEVLGDCYRSGNGVEKDDLEALKWYEKAADAGSADSQNLVGNVYFNAEIVPQDYEKAFSYYQKAAAQGQIYGMLNLGTSFVSGNGCAINVEEGIRWIEKAADQDCPEAIEWIARWYYDNKQYNEAMPWLMKGAENGDSDTQKNLGNCYYDGNGVDQDFSKAYFWWKKSADQGHDGALGNLGLLFQDGLGVPQDLSVAADHFYQAALADVECHLNNLNVIIMKNPTVATMPMMDLLRQKADSIVCQIEVTEDLEWLTKWAEESFGYCLENLTESEESWRKSPVCLLAVERIIELLENPVDIDAVAQNVLEYTDDGLFVGGLDHDTSDACLLLSLKGLTKAKGEGIFDDKERDEKRNEIIEECQKRGLDVSDYLEKSSATRKGSNTANAAAAFFEKVWVTQGDNSSIIIHANFNVTNAQNQHCHMRYHTRLTSGADIFPERELDCIPLYEDTLWKDFQFILYENEQAWPTSDWHLCLKTSVTFVDGDGNECGWSEVTYAVGHRIRAFHKNELLLINK